MRKAEDALSRQINPAPHTEVMNATTPAGSDRLLAQLAAIPSCQKPNEDADWFPPVDILEDADEYLFKIDLPDVKVENLHVFLEGDALVIAGERPNPWQDNHKYLRVERPYGHFERRFTLPADSSQTEISSLFAESILELHFPKVTPPVTPSVAAAASPKLKLRSIP